jgi:hypothetical protein
MTISEYQVHKAIKAIIDDAPLHVLQDYVYETMLMKYEKEDAQTRAAVYDLVKE